MPARIASVERPSARAAAVAARMLARCGAPIMRLANAMRSPPASIVPRMPPMSVPSSVQRTSPPRPKVVTGTSSSRTSAMTRGSSAFSTALLRLPDAGSSSRNRRAFAAK